MLRGHRTIVPAKAEIQGKAVRDFEIVLHEWGEVHEPILVQVPCHVCRAKRPRLERRSTAVVSQQEVGNRVACAAKGCSTPVAAVRSVADDQVVRIAEVSQKIGGQITLLEPPAVIESGTEGVPPLDDRHRIGKLPGWNVAGGGVITLTAHGRVRTSQADRGE